MNRILVIGSFSMLLMSLCASGAPLGTTFTYQGQLKRDGVPYDGLAEVRFSLWTDLVAGSQVGLTLERNNLDVVNGLFTVDDLDFTAGSFAGEARYLQVAVKAPAGVGSFVPVSPRQPITPAPYAIHALNAPVGFSLDAVDGSPSDAVFVDGVGNVGIGTTAPQQTLSVQGGMNVDQANSNSGTTTAALRFGSNSGEVIGSKRTAGGNQYGLDFYTNSINRLAITNQGNVGIGTTSPTAKLHIGGTAGVDGIRFPDGTSQTSAAPDGHSLNAADGSPVDALFVNNAGQVGIGTTTPSGPLHILSALAPPGSLPGGQNGLLLGSNGEAAYKWVQSYNGALALNPAGNNVGIGTSSPQQNLSVQGGMNIDQGNQNIGTTTSTLRFGSSSGEAIGSKRTAGGNQFGLDFYTTSASRMSITNDGNVGIGTPSPSRRLEVVDAGDIEIGLRSSDAGGRTWTLQSSGVNGGADDGTFQIIDRTPGSVASRVTIDPAGEVGIGTTNPSAPLHVNGDARIDGQVTIEATTRYLTLTAAAFTGLNHATIDSSDGSPLLQDDGFSIAWSAAAQVSLPHGAVVTRMDVFVSDYSDEGNMTVSLTRNPVDSDNPEALASGSTTGSPGSVTLTDTSISFATIDNLNYRYHIWVRGDGQPLIRTFLSTVRITYTVTAPLP